MSKEQFKISRRTFNEEKVVTLKHMVVRLVGPDYGGRKKVVKQTVEADICWTISLMMALCGEWLLTSVCQT